MKKPGLIGGMGPESTVPYYHELVCGVQQRLGADVYPELTLESVNVFEVLRLCTERKYDELAEYLLRAINNVAACGADFAAMCANTPHIVFDRLRERSPIPLISIVEATSAETKRRGIRRAGLLGTMFTMRGAFYRGPFDREGIELITPRDDEMEYIAGRIASELELGIIKNDTLRGFQRVIGRMAEDDGIEAVILGCTEIPLLLNDGNTPVPCLDTMRIHIDAIIDRVLS